jgi:hypothetical protein
MILKKSYDLLSFYFINFFNKKIDKILDFVFDWDLMFFVKKQFQIPKF